MINNVRRGIVSAANVVPYTAPTGPLGIVSSASLVACWDGTNYDDVTGDWPTFQGTSYTLTQATAGKRPTLGTINSLSCPSFNATNKQILSIGSVGPGGGDDTEWHAFIVFQTTTVAAGEAHMLVCPNFNHTRNGATFITYDAGSSVSSTGSKQINTTYITHLRYKPSPGSLIYLSTNREPSDAASTNGSGIASTGAVHVGGPDGVDGNFDGKIAAIALFNGTLDIIDAHNLVKYYAKRWGAWPLAFPPDGV